MGHKGSIVRFHTVYPPATRLMLYGACVQVPPNYDSLLGKLIVWGADRPAAIARMKVRSQPSPLPAQANCSNVYQGHD